MPEHARNLPKQRLSIFETTDLAPKYSKYKHDSPSSHLVAVHGFQMYIIYDYIKLYFGLNQDDIQFLVK